MVRTNSSKAEVTSVIVTDPHPLARYGLIALLEPQRGMRVVAEAPTADEAVRSLRSIRRTRCVLVVSLGLTGLHDSYWLMRSVRRQMPWVKVLATGPAAGSSDVSRCLFEGADGFVDKTLGCEVFLRGIDLVCTGMLVLETTSDVDASDILRDLESQRRIANLLTEREREILLLAADGLTARQIGTSLGLSDRTITTHFGRIYSKLGVNSRLGAIKAATRCGAISSSNVTV